MIYATPDLTYDVNMASLYKEEGDNPCGCCEREQTQRCGVRNAAVAITSILVINKVKLLYVCLLGGETGLGLLDVRHGGVRK
jgi:hypothetical protein